MNRSISTSNSLYERQTSFCDNAEIRKCQSLPQLYSIDNYDYGPFIRFNLNVILLILQSDPKSDNLHASSVQSMHNLIRIIGNDPIYIDHFILKTKPNVYVTRFFDTIELKKDAIGVHYYGIKSPMFVHHENFPCTETEIEKTEQLIVNVLKKLNPKLSFKKTFFDDFWYKVSPVKYASYKEDMAMHIKEHKSNFTLNYINIFVYSIFTIILVVFKCF